MIVGKNMIRVIATHNGPFHADDAVAVAALRVLNPEAKVIRTRNPELLATADIRVDVGGVYDPANNTLDHHFKDSPEGPLGVRLSSAGMVWLHFGEQIVQALGVSADNAKAVTDEVYKSLIAAVDAGDNGQSEPYAAPGVENFTLAHAVGTFSPSWDEDQSPASFDAAFEAAVKMVDQVLRGQVRMAYGSIKARNIVLEACAGDPEVVVFDKFVPWADTLIDATRQTKFVVFPSPGDTWMVQCVPPATGSFDKRLPLPADWAGARDAALEEITGVPGAVFCHPGAFICGARTKDGALALAELALGKETK